MFITLLAIIAFIRKKDPEPIFGVYSQRGKWFYLKYFFLLCILWIEKWRHGDKRKSTPEIRELDKPSQLSPDPNSSNAVSYAGGNSAGWRFVMGIERRHQGIAHGVLYFLVPGKGLYCMPKTPDTLTFNTADGEECGSFRAGGIFTEPTVAMEKWSLIYKGDLLHEGKIVKNCRFEGEFCSAGASGDHFDFYADSSIQMIAKSIATEPWSREYFRNLKTFRDDSSRIEQTGRIEGKLIVDGESHELLLDGVRDLVCDRIRNWANVHRYATFRFFLENDAKFSIMFKNEPGLSSNFKVGYVCTEGKYAPIVSSDFELYQHGEGGRTPQDCAFLVETAEKKYTVEVQVIYQGEHFVGNDWEARRVQRFIQVKVNGMPGHGVSEFHYKNNSGRGDQATDPQWYRSIIQSK